MTTPRSPAGVRSRPASDPAMASRGMALTSATDEIRPRIGTYSPKGTRWFFS
jgi:hypothetical protein